MAAYNFQKQFVPLIESGAKRSTIRQRRKNGYLPRPGDVLRLYSGMRTKSCKLIREAAVIAVTPITINAANGCADVVLNGVRLLDSDVSALARSDGFKGIIDFAVFFEQMYGGSVSGYLIQWQK